MQNKKAVDYVAHRLAAPSGSASPRVIRLFYFARRAFEGTKGTKGTKATAKEEAPRQAAARFLAFLRIFGVCPQLGDFFTFLHSI